MKPSNRVSGADEPVTTLTRIGKGSPSDRSASTSYGAAHRKRWDAAVLCIDDRGRSRADEPSREPGLGVRG